MGVSIKSLLIVMMLGLFVSMYFVNFIASQAEYMGVASNITAPIDPALYNETRSSTDTAFAAMQSSSSDQTSEITLFKNVPSVIKSQISLTTRGFGYLIGGAHTQYLPAWVIGIIVVILMIIVVGALIRGGRGSTL